MTRPHSLRRHGFLAFALLALAAEAGLGTGLWLGFRQLDDAASMPGFATAGVAAGFILLGLIAGAWRLFDERFARPAGRLAAGLAARAHGAAPAPFDPALAAELGGLGPAASAMAQALEEARGALAASVARETLRLAEEKARLEALLSDVPVGVLLCSDNHQLVFYNGQAAALLGAALAPGLQRPVFDFLREAPVLHAHQRLAGTADPDAASDLTVATLDGARVLSGRMRFLDASGVGGGAGSGPGYVLTIGDVTADLAQHTEREALLAELLERVRRPAAALLSVTGLLAEAPEALADPALLGALGQEAARLAEAVTELGQRSDAGATAFWPMSQTRADDLAEAIGARIEAAGLSIARAAQPLVLRCGAFGLTALIAALAEAVSREAGGRAMALAIEADGAGALVALSWQGRPASVAELERWLDRPLEVGLADTTGRSVLAAHGSDCWPEPGAHGRARLVLPLREARAEHRRPPPAARAVVYDFELLSRPPPADLADARLEDLVHVVFDTETTGLSPEAGDEIVQIAGLRIVNGRRRAAEVFETLVDPGRPIPALATEVHGIDAAMVRGAPTPAEALARFHDFAGGAVLIAHNAPFDLAFLRRHEAAFGGRFDHPVLDTVLLSAVVFGQSEAHSLDALAHRLGIVIPEAERHTAMGDAVATADAFLRMLPMLRARGLERFGQVIAEARRHGRLIADMNR